MYAQVCMHPDIAYIIGMLGRYLSNPGKDHWIAAERVMRYLQRTKDYMLTYRKLDQFEIIGYSDSDFAGCRDSMKSTSSYIYLLAGGAISWKSVKQLYLLPPWQLSLFLIMRHPIMEYGCEILSRGCVLWMALKDHLSYFVTINQL